MKQLNQQVKLRVGMLAERFHCSNRTAKRDIEKLREAGLVEFHGATRSGHYRARGSA